MPTTQPLDPRLHNIEGRWRTSGQVIGDRPMAVTGTDIYEVFPGGHFLVHHVDVTVGAQRVRAIEMIGERDTATGAYLARSFDADGTVEVMQLTIDDRGTFHFLGGGNVAPAAQSGQHRVASVRSTLAVAKDRRSMHARWERSDNGNDWRPWMEIDFTPEDF